MAKKKPGKQSASASKSGAVGIAKWAFKTFWFPVLLFALRKLGEKHEWADKTHRTLKTFK